MGRKPIGRSAVGERIKLLFEEGETYKAFAARVGISERMLGSYMRGENRPSPEFLTRLRALGADVNWVLTGDADLSAFRLLADRDLQNEEREKAEFEAGFSRGMKKLYGSLEPAGEDVERALGRIATQPGAMHDEVPIHGTAAGSLTGSMAITSYGRETVLRPPGLKHSPAAYALYVRGVSMQPRFSDGDLIFIDPDAVCKAGDAVVIQTQNHEGADVLSWIKEFVRRHPDELVVRQYNPLAEVRFKASRIRAVHRVLTLRDLFGL